MTERECQGNARCADGGLEFHPGRMPRTGRRSGVVLPAADRSSPGRLDSETVLLEGIKSSPRRSSIIKDSSAQRAGVRKKTVSFSSVPSERKVSSAADCLAFMQAGCELRKVRPNSRIYCRFYTLDPELTCLRWEPSKKDSERARLDISTICEVRTGKSTDTFRHSPAEHLPDEAAFSIVHGDGCQSLDLVALSPDVANIWVTGLRYLVSHPAHVRSSIDEGSPGSRMRREWLAVEFGETDKDGYGIVSEDTAVATICRLCPSVKETKVRLRFKEIQLSKEKLTSHVTLEEFQEAYCELCTRPDVYFLMVQLSQDRECLGVQDLRLFLETEQGLPLATAEGCLDIVHRFEPSSRGREQGLLGLDGFARYLQSTECQLFDPEHQSVCQDMGLPVSQYYISTSYRSYLLEDQVHGSADLGGLLCALQAGCRCLELGVTEGPGGEPLLGVARSPSLRHPHRNPSMPVTARAALELLNTHAFLTSPYPLLLYLCQRCSLEQQRVLARHLREVFGPRLYTHKVPQTLSSERGPGLPSPEELKGHVLLVAKRLPPEQEGSEGEVSEEEEEAGDMGLLAGRRMTIPGEEELGVVLVVPPPPQPLRLRLCRELSELVAVGRSNSHYFYRHRSQRQKSCSPSASAPSSPSVAAPQATTCWTMCSIGEGEAGRLASESPEDMVDFTKHRLVRVRPGSVRLDSSNPNPQDFWKGGCQLVALNVQTPGVMLDLHQARFAQNGSCGFTLMPAAMREAKSYFSTDTLGCVPGVLPQMLCVRVISAHGLPKPPGSGAKGEVIDPYVVLELHGVPADCAEEHTRTAAQNQDDPLFDETFEFQVHMPELAILRFVVLDDDYIGDDFIGQYSVTFDCLQPGYRTVPLLGLAGEPLPHANLFVHVAVTNRRGGGKAHRRSLSVRKGVRRGHEYVSLRNLGIKTLDDAFCLANAPLKEATDLRANAKAAMISFIERCGLPLEAKPKQCIQSIASRVQDSEGPLEASLVLRDGYPYLDVQGNVPESIRKLVDYFDTMITAQRQLIENADGVREHISQVQKEGMELHGDLPTLGEEEDGPRGGRRRSKTVENFAWNITVLKGQCDLLCNAKADTIDTLQQLALACEACGLTTANQALPSLSPKLSSHRGQTRRGSTQGSG